MTKKTWVIAQEDVTKAQKLIAFTLNEQAAIKI